MEANGRIERLNRAQNAVLKGETQIRRQRELVTRLEQAGGNTRQARALLNALVERQCKYQKELASIIREFQEDS
jgi:hypothetical protein